MNEIIWLMYAGMIAEKRAELMPILWPPSVEVGKCI